jgi:phosphodiesterase/alkaline phosphatase D-like protein
MYLVAWDEANWPDHLPSTAEALAAGARGRLEQARRALPAVRRVLANIPTYMVFDDHDVNDDWNATREWRDRVWRSTGCACSPTKRACAPRGR